MGQEFAGFFTTDLEPHFQEEEEFVLPLAGRSTSLAALVSNVRLDHDALRAAVAELASSLARQGDPRPILLRIEARLTTHVRFEEEELFQALQRMVPEASLQELWRRSHAFRTHHRSPAACGVHPGPAV